MIQTPTIIPYNADTPIGQAITHLLRKSALYTMRGLDVETVDEHGGRQLEFRGHWHPSDGEATLLLFAESLAGRSGIIMRHALEEVDAASARAMAEAVMIAAGLHGQTMVIVP
jgi:hypothetical protein